MRTIYKYPVTITDRFTLRLPIGAQFNHFGLQNGSYFVWFELYTDSALEDVEFAIFGTGGPMPKGNWIFCGTIISEPFVWHLYRKF